jgi:hypothetical protein
MGKIRDLSGNRFGRLTAIDVAGRKKYKSGTVILWNCLCDCGNSIITSSQSLIKGYTKSCGCLKAELNKIRGIENSKHSLSHTDIWNIYYGMKDRCYNKKHPSYPRYGGRGITICEEWLNDIRIFNNWCISNGYSKGLSIDRIDNNGNYEPNNCRFVDAKSQARNRSTNIVVEYNEEKMTLPELSEICNIPYATLRARYKKGDRGETLVRPLEDTRKTTAKLTNSQVLDIRRKFSEGVPPNVLDKEYGVSRQTIFNIVYMKTYKDVK